MSVFLAVAESSWVAKNDLAFAIRDQFPVSPGHTLVITRRLVSDWFSATEAERAALMSLVEEVKRTLDKELQPDGYNVGFNAGLAAGQTVMHLHVHVIPRFSGDMDDPAGGVRHVIPSKGNYRRKVRPLSSGGIEDPFSRHIFPLFNSATEIAIVAAFVQETGLDLIESHVRAAITRGANVRILTGDYLDITQASALELLLDWERTAAARDDDDEARTQGSLEARLIEVERLPGLTRAFHPKAWRFEAPEFGVAFVGSSNLSRSALETGIEWNLRVDRDRDLEAYHRVRDAFEDLWTVGRRLDGEWIAAYAQRAREQAHRLPPGEQEAEPLPAPPAEHEVQTEALAQLRAARLAGRRRALAVLATGLGKTWLAAFDHLQLAEEIGGPTTPRVLFVAHRKELLTQASKTFQRSLRSRGLRGSVTWCLADENDLTGTLVMASVAKLARGENLTRLLAANRFDYVVIDEVHHAAARSYRDILRTLEQSPEKAPRFTLGLTATPERADSADILGLFDDFTAYSAGIDRGIEIGRLVPFAYLGVKDDIDYANIPWRNRRFDLEALAASAQTESRMQTLWSAWGMHTGTRTLVFCCNIAHANFVRDWLRAHKVRVRVVYAGPGSDDRDDALRALEAGEIDAVCSVDVFNEGVDVPLVDRVVMLRPTESSVVFLQQLGRGLRAADGKSLVKVIDFVGNHRVFIDRLRALLSLGGDDAEQVSRLLEPTPVELPSGCSVELQLEAKDLLRTFFTKKSGADGIVAIYRELREQRDERPTAGELQRMGYPPARLRDEQRYEGWFDFVSQEGDLDERQRAAFAQHRRFLSEVEQTEMSRSFKMVTLEALLDAGALRKGLGVQDLSARAFALMRRSPELFADIAEASREESLEDRQALKRWGAYWKSNPLKAWTSERAGGRTWFKLENEHFAPAFAVTAEHEPVLAELVRELVDLRLAQYRSRRRIEGALADGFVCRVLSNTRDPILKLPPRNRVVLPEGETDVRLEGGVWQFRFMKEFCNVARRSGEAKNELPDLLRRWFGLAAGKPGTAFEVRFEKTPDGWWVEPVRSNVIQLAERRGVATYPDLRAAAGHASEGADTTRSMVLLPIEKNDADVFAVRVAGTSMDGGKAPMRNGDWAVLRLARSAAPSAMEDRVVLVQLPASLGSQYQLKRLRRSGGKWQLTSDNPAGPTFDANADMVPIARLEQVVTPESMAPRVGTVLGEEELATAFGLENLRAKTGRVDGHLFVFVTQRGELTAPNRVQVAGVIPRVAETAFILAPAGDGAFRYLGVGRWLDDEAKWAIPEVDFTTWRTWGEGRESSRTLPDGALGRAQVVIDELLARPAEQQWLERADGRRARVLGAAARGGLRIDGGEGGFTERTVSVNDLAWVVAADDWAKENQTVLDEAVVNRCRYLAGTPKGSTRFIDTGWALALWQNGKGLVDRAAGGASASRKVRGANKKPLDATYSIEPVGDRLSIIFEARGGTAGSGGERNTEYVEGLRTLLERLGKHGIALEDAFVESRDTLTLSPDERRIALTYPLSLDDADAARRALSSGQAKIGRRPGAKGSGNSTRRLRLLVKGVSVATLAKTLS